MTQIFNIFIRVYLRASRSASHSSSLLLGNNANIKRRYRLTWR